MLDTKAFTDSPVNGPEAYATLLQIAGRRTLHIPAEILVRCVLALPGEWDWPVRRAALEAVLRRVASRLLGTDAEQTTPVPTLTESLARPVA